MSISFVSISPYTLNAEDCNLLVFGYKNKEMFAKLKMHKENTDKLLEILTISDLRFDDQIIANSSNIKISRYFVKR